MKTSIKNLFAAVATVIILTTSAFAATGVNEKNVTILNQVKNINKIIVNGNVEVILVQAPTESVKVYDSYYSKNALVQQENGELRISSFQKEALVVAVYVRNLSTIEASDNAQVKTFGKVSFLKLDVLLSGSASADIDANALEMYTAVKDNASLKLSGKATDHYAVLGSQAKLNMEKFNADCSSVHSSNPVLAEVIVSKANTLPADDFMEISK